MAYNLMKILIKNKKRSNEELTKMANVYYAAGQLNDEQYAEIISLIK